MVFAEAFFPGHRGFASSVILGFGGSLASFSVLPISYFAEGVRLIQAFWLLPFFWVTSICLVLRLPKNDKEMRGKLIGRHPAIPRYSGLRPATAHFSFVVRDLAVFTLRKDPARLRVGLP